jgi:hypothetical protein
MEEWASGKCGGSREGLRRSGNGRGHRVFRGGFLFLRAVVIHVNDAPGAGDMAAAGGVEIGALGEVELDGVDEAHGE